MAKAKACDGKQVLQLWKSCYLDVRAKIEMSGRDSRWEFDRKKLFERTDYMATICQDIYDILQVAGAHSPLHSTASQAVLLHSEELGHMV